MNGLYVKSFGEFSISDGINSISDSDNRSPGVCHFRNYPNKNFSLFCKVFLAFFILLCYNVCIGL